MIHNIVLLVLLSTLGPHSALVCLDIMPISIKYVGNVVVNVRNVKTHLKIVPNVKIYGVPYPYVHVWLVTLKMLMLMDNVFHVAHNV